MLSLSEQIDLYNEQYKNVFDFCIDTQDHVRISRYYDSPERTSIDIPSFVYGFDKPNLPSEKGVFSNAKHLKEIHIHSNLKDLSLMFYYSNIENLNLSDWDVSNVTNMSYMFANSKIVSIGDLSNWNVSKVTNMKGIFNYSRNLNTTYSLDNWNVSNVIDMNNMFYESHLISIGNLNNWNISNVTDMNNMFNTPTLTSIGDLSHWDVSIVDDMSEIFNDATNIPLDFLSNWNIPHTNKTFSVDAVTTCNFKPYEGKENYIFVCYSHKNKKTICPILNALHDKGFRIWYDKGIHAGDEWNEIIAENISQCSLFLAFKSKNSLNSKFCKREITFASNNDKDILCIHLDETKMSKGLEMIIDDTQSIHYYKTNNISSLIEELEDSNLLKEGFKEF